MTHNNESTIPRAYKGVYLDELERLLSHTGEFMRMVKLLDQRLESERSIDRSKIEDSELLKLKAELENDRMPRVLLQLLAELTVRYRNSISNMEQVKIGWRNNDYYYGFSDDDVESLASQWAHGHHHGGSFDPSKGEVRSVKEHDLKLASSHFSSKQAVSGKYIVVEGYKHFDTLTSLKLNTDEVVYFATSGSVPFGNVKAGLAVAADQKSREITGFGESVPANGPAGREAAKLLREHKADLIS